VLDAGKIHRALADLGHACDMSVAQDGTPSLAFSTGATQEQMAAALRALAGLDLRPRRRRAMAAILADLNAMSGAQRLSLVVRWLAQAAADEPGLLRRLGQAIDGDEPES
jgi:hypothetical protein